MTTRARASWALARTPLASAGVVLTTLCGVLFVVLFLLDALGRFSNPYLGLLLFVALPIGFVAGLALIPLGNRLHSRGGVSYVWPAVDLNLARHRTIAFIVLAATALNVVIITMATSGALHYMETVAFCGQVCHTAMEPQFVAYQRAPHSRVPCVNCHVGSGTRAALRSKVEGTRQLIGVLTGRVPRPIPSPVGEMRTARETCGSCHRPDMRHGETVKTRREFAPDETNTESVTRLTMNVGPFPDAAQGVASDTGASVARRGIHWHALESTVIEYVATDSAHQTIPLVVLHEPDGRQTEFRVDGSLDAVTGKAERHQMDCLDCHSRPSHTFDESPERAVDEALATGRLNRALPFLKRDLVAALKEPYETHEAAARGLALRLNEVAARLSPAPAAPDVRRVVEVAQELYSANVFPAMAVEWGTYGTELGHSVTPGCFRCHDDRHKSSDGRVIRQDCELCHEVTFGESANAQ